MRLAVTAGACVSTLIGLLTAMDGLAPPYDAARRRLVAGGPLGHLDHILSFAGNQVNHHGAHGIASYPWEWWIDVKPIVYLNINPSQPAPGLEHIHPAVHFLGVISPAILLLALPALWLSARSFRRGTAIATGGELDLFALAWVAGTFLPFELASLVLGRTSYLYYMVIVMPGVYIAVARLVATIAAPRWARIAWIAAVAIAAIVMYPLTPLP